MTSRIWRGIKPNSCPSYAQCVREEHNPPRLEISVIFSSSLFLRFDSSSSLTHLVNPQGCLYPWNISQIHPFLFISIVTILTQVLTIFTWSLVFWEGLSSLYYSPLSNLFFTLQSELTFKEKSKRQKDRDKKKMTSGPLVPLLNYILNPSTSHSTATTVVQITIISHLNYGNILNWFYHFFSGHPPIRSISFNQYIVKNSNPIMSLPWLKSFTSFPLKKEWNLNSTPRPTKTSPPIIYLNYYIFSSLKSIC